VDEISEGIFMSTVSPRPADNSVAAPAMLIAHDIRALRRARGLTLAEMALKLGRSIGWVSQVERGLSLPSIEDLRRFADLFAVPLSMFFGHEAANEAERGVIVRAGHRRALGSSETGLTEELLSPDLGGSFELIRSEFAPGAEMTARAQRETEDAGYVVSGRFDIEIAGIWHSLGEGDSFRFGKKPYRWRNPGTVPAVVIWAVSPPVY
jgi:transcriptional regulator with XRE-family HTH domain